MPEKPTMEYLAERVRILQQQQDESAWNELALIATLKELLPGFSQRFAQLHIAAQKVTSPETPKELAELVAAMKRRVQ